MLHSTKHLFVGPVSITSTQHLFQFEAELIWPTREQEVQTVRAVFSALKGTGQEGDGRYSACESRLDEDFTCCFFNAYTVQASKDFKWSIMTFIVVVKHFKNRYNIKISIFRGMSNVKCEGFA